MDIKLHDRFPNYNDSFKFRTENYEKLSEEYRKFKPFRFGIFRQIICFILQTFFFLLCQIICFTTGPDPDPGPDPESGLLVTFLIMI